MKRTSLKEISRITGFSVTTVSMVLNGRAEEFNIAEKTKLRILEAAETHNYRPNLHARNLRNKTSNILGLMVPALTNRFFSSMAETFEKLARDNDKFALITVTHHDRKEELNAVEYFVSQNADCIFTANPTALSEVSEVCSNAGIEQIVLDAPESGKCTVTTDNFTAARDLTRRLLKAMNEARCAGRVYYIGGMETHSVTRQRLQGFVKALEEEGRAFAGDQFVPTPFDPQAASEAFAQLFKKKSDVAGIFVNSLNIMEGLIRYFPENAEACRAVRYGVFDYHPIMGLLNLNVLSVMQDADRMMQTAYEIYAGGTTDAERRIFHIPYRIIPPPVFSP